MTIQEISKSNNHKGNGVQTFVFTGGYCLYTFHQQVVRLAKRRPDVKFTFEWVIQPRGEVLASTVAITCTSNTPRALPFWLFLIGDLLRIFAKIKIINFANS